ncbi:MAG: cysteine desulfurase [Pirellulaceae bacterium]|nr:cysteine desulfurase [Pirellulaceae bacterium]
MNCIYLDHNATTPLDPRVAEAMLAVWRDYPANPASQHGPGRRAARLLEDQRERVAELLGAGPATRVVFTSGATEANNLALRGLAGSSPGRVIVSAIEHPSGLEPAVHLQRAGWQVAYAPVRSTGVVDVERLSKLLENGSQLVSLIWVNHETGVIQPLDEVARLCRERRIPLHTDAVQAVGKLPVDFDRLGVAALSLSAHKLHGPVGVGALLVRAGVPIQPILQGGFQQFGLRPGTESLALAVGLRTALELAVRELDERARHLTLLRDRFESTLLAADPTIRIHGREVPRAPHTSNISLPGLDRQAVWMALDLAGIACSTGSACASGSSELSPVLRAMGVAEPELRSALRFSFGRLTTIAEVDQACERILLVARELRERIRG